MRIPRNTNNRVKVMKVRKAVDADAEMNKGTNYRIPVPNYVDENNSSEAVNLS